ncbi:hypothetical protein JOM56_006806 [Amanita muscaria]
MCRPRSSHLRKHFLHPSVRYARKASSAFPTSNRAISYVLLCGSSPFRSDRQSLCKLDHLKDTTEAKIEIHERYWKNVSDF